MRQRTINYINVNVRYSLVKYVRKIKWLQFRGEFLTFDTNTESKPFSEIPKQVNVGSSWVKFMKRATNLRARSIYFSSQTIFALTFQNIKTALYFNAVTFFGYRLYCMFKMCI